MGDRLLQSLHAQEAKGSCDSWAVATSESATTATAFTAKCTTTLDPPVVTNATDLTSRKRFLAVLNGENLLEVLFELMTRDIKCKRDWQG